MAAVIVGKQTAAAAAAAASGSMAWHLGGAHI